MGCEDHATTCSCWECFPQRWGQMAPHIVQDKAARPLRLVMWPRLDPGEQLRVDGITDGALIQVGLGAPVVKLDASECESVAAVLLSAAEIVRHRERAAAIGAAEHGYRPEGEDAI